MSSDIDIQVLQNTQEVLGKYIKKPPLTEKLLRKPPFRFLHDVITNVVRETGFLKGLYSERELVSENVKEKDDKIAFLNKVIEATKAITGMDLAVRSSKVIAGFEPYETNLFLQAIGSALDRKLDSSEYVSQLNVKKQAPKKHETTKESEKKSKTSKNKDKLLKNSKEKENSTKITKSQVKQKSSDTKVNNKKLLSKISKIPVGNDQANNLKDGLCPEPDEDGSKSNLSEVNLENELHSSVKNVPQLRKSRDMVPGESTNGNDASKVKLCSSDTITEDSVQAKDIETPTVPTSDSNNQFMLPLQVNETKDTLEGEKIQESDAYDFKHMDVKQRLPTSRPKSSIRPLSTRPSSSRPGAPRLQKNDSFITKEKDILPVGKVNIIDESVTNEYVDEEETVTVETAPEIEYQAPLLDLPTDKGHLVEQILEQINSNDIEPIKSNVNVEWEQAGMRSRNTAIKEVEQMKSAIQDLTKMVNPLGKLINYLHEDIEAMYNELDMWNNSVRQIMIDVVNQKKKRDESNVPLQTKLNEVEENIIKYQQQIISTYSNIMRNEERIQDLLVK